MWFGIIHGHARIVDRRSAAEDFLAWATGIANSGRDTGRREGHLAGLSNHVVEVAPEEGQAGRGAVRARPAGDGAFFSPSRTPVVSRAGSSLCRHAPLIFRHLHLSSPRGRSFPAFLDRPPDIEKSTAKSRPSDPPDSITRDPLRSSRTPGYEIRSPRYVYGRGTTRTASRTRRPRSPWEGARRSSTRRR